MTKGDALGLLTDLGQTADILTQTWSHPGKSFNGSFASVSRN